MKTIYVRRQPHGEWHRLTFKNVRALHAFLLQGRVCDVRFPGETLDTESGHWQAP